MSFVRSARNKYLSYDWWWGRSVSQTELSAQSERHAAKEMLGEEDGRAPLWPVLLLFLANTGTYSKNNNKKANDIWIDCGTGLGMNETIDYSPQVSRDHQLSAPITRVEGG